MTLIADESIIIKESDRSDLENIGICETVSDDRAFIRISNNKS
jgi:hypothetical protein